MCCEFKGCTYAGVKYCKSCYLQFCKEHYVDVRYGHFKIRYVCISCLSQDRFFEKPTYGNYTYYDSVTSKQLTIDELQHIKSKGLLLTKKC